MASLIWWLSYILRIHTPTLIGSSFELVAFDPAQEKRGKKLKDLMYMLVIYCCFSSVQTERKNHDFSSHVVVIRPKFYIINDAFSRFMAITIFCWRVQRCSMFHSISWKEIIIFSPFANNRNCIL